eukprot:TRINITY_DN3331_c0_g1_i4.p1 TRINITY_DN3331_c0_g1~~TRINITY_DN3331_c0_g1_i4.p1  ORF type:complete len:529 (+),score=126.19 TRINITY_DN3331_c0_g1_i4:647-2233(+)
MKLWIRVTTRSLRCRSGRSSSASSGSEADETAEDALKDATTSFRGVGELARKFVENFGSLQRTYEALDASNHKKFTLSQWQVLFKVHQMDTQELCGVSNAQLFRMMDVMDGERDFAITSDGWKAFFRQQLVGTEWEYLLEQDNGDVQHDKLEQPRHEKHSSSAAYLEVPPAPSRSRSKEASAAGSRGGSRRGSKEAAAAGSRTSSRSPCAEQLEGGNVEDAFRERLENYKTESGYGISEVPFGRTANDDFHEDGHTQDEIKKEGDELDRQRHDRAYTILFNEAENYVSSNGIREELHSFVGEEKGTHAGHKASKVEKPDLEKETSLPPLKQRNASNSLPPLKLRNAAKDTGSLQADGSTGRLTDPGAMDAATFLAGPSKGKGASAATTSGPDSNAKTSFAGDGVSSSEDDDDIRNMDRQSLAQRMFETYATGQWRGVNVFIRAPDLEHFAEDIKETFPEVKRIFRRMRGKLNSLFDDTIELQCRMAERGFRSTAGLTMDWFQIFVQKVVNLFGMQVMGFFLMMLERRM